MRHLLCDNKLGNHKMMHLQRAESKERQAWPFRPSEFTSKRGRRSSIHAAPLRSWWSHATTLFLSFVSFMKGSFRKNKVGKAGRDKLINCMKDAISYWLYHIVSISLKWKWKACRGSLQDRTGLWREALPLHILVSFWRRAAQWVFLDKWHNTILVFKKIKYMGYEKTDRSICVFVCGKADIMDLREHPRHSWLKSREITGLQREANSQIDGIVPKFSTTLSLKKNLQKTRWNTISRLFWAFTWCRRAVTVLWAVTSQGDLPTLVLVQPCAE